MRDAIEPQDGEMEQFTLVCWNCYKSSEPMVRDPGGLLSIDLMQAANLIGWTTYFDGGVSVIVCDSDDCHRQIFTKSGAIRRRRPKREAVA